MLAEIEIRKLLADAYHRAALDGEADMRLVTDALETIRIPFMQEHAMNVWNSVTLNGTTLDRPFIRSLFLQLRKQYQQALLQNITGEIQKGFEQSAVKGWEQFITVYTDALIYWNGEIFGPLCEYPFPFSSEMQVSVQQLKKLNRLVFESRWLDAESLYEWLMAQPGVNEAQRAAIHLVLGEIELFHQLRPDVALGHFQEAEKVLGKTSRVYRTYAEYYQKTGDVSQCREMINLAIANDDNDLENFLLMGDTYRDEGKPEIAEQWYRDAINVNFLKADPYVKVMSIHGDPSKYKEKGGEMRTLLATIESLEPETAFTNIVYNAYRDAGSLYSANGMPAEAQDCYRRAIDLHTEWVTAYIDLGYVLGMEQKYAESEKCFQAALEKDPSCYDALNGMAWLAEQSNDLERAIEYQKQCLTVRPAAAAIINNNIGVLTGNMGDYAGSKNYYQLAIQSNPRVALYYTNLAYASEKLNDIETAIKAYEQAIALEPFNAVFHNKLGNLYYSKDDFEHAKACYEHAVEQNGSVAVYYENLGLANFNLGLWSESASAYEKAVALAPSWSAYNYLGINYYRLGDYEKAVTNYSRAIELEHSTAILYDNLGLAYDQLGKKEKAEKAFLNALKLEPENYTFLNRLGVFYYNHGKYGEAIACYKRAIQYGKGEQVLFDNLALACMAAGRFSEAREIFEHEIENAERKDWVYNLIGLMHFNEQHLPDAIENYQKAIAINKDETVYWTNLALAYRDSGKLAEAESAMKQAVQLNPSQENKLHLGEISDLISHESR
jgi:tetratricopeptide (TPR) repeat protein